MADVTVTIQVSSVEYTTWIRSSMIALSQINENGAPMIDKIELGPDQEVVFDEFLPESALDVLKIFTSRQGDVSGTPYEISSASVIYRFNELEPTLTHSASLKLQLNEDVKNAIYSKIAMSWFFTKNMEKVAAYYLGKYETLLNSIDKILYLLHD